MNFWLFSSELDQFRKIFKNKTEINNKRGSGALQKADKLLAKTNLNHENFVKLTLKMDGWPYSAYNRLPQGSADFPAQYSNTNSAQQLLLHHQLRQAQQVHQYLPPSLVAAASNQNKSQQNVSSGQSASSWKSNSNGLVIIPEPQKATSNRSYSNSSELLVESVAAATNSRTMRNATELKTSQPVFPGQPPPLSRFEAGGSGSSGSSSKQNYSPQPPPRQSSQPPQRSSSINRTAFPGQQPPVPVRILKISFLF